MVVIKKHGFLFLLFKLVELFVCSSFANAAEFVGDFSNIRYTEEHSYGVGVDIWKDKKATCRAEKDP